MAGPACIRVYQNHPLDSTRWQHIALRPGDIVISTAYKAGTTFTQTIVGNLLFCIEPPVIVPRQDLTAAAVGYE